MRYILILFICLPILSHAQTVKIIAEKNGFSFRGLSVVDQNIVWVSGSNGMVGKSIDGGKTWDWITIKGYENRDFRDIEAFDERTAIIMAIAEPAMILKTDDGGANWKTIFIDSTKGMFLDAMDFMPNGQGMVIGDPVNGKLFQAQTSDFGETWTKIELEYLKQVKDGEAMFASSGTNIRLIDKNTPVIITGGKTSRLWIKNKILNLPIIQGCNSCGGNSVAVKTSLFHGRKIIVVGGDFLIPTQIKQNCVLSNNFGKKWVSPTQPPNGYRSSVEFINTKKLITCGISGVDISFDGGYTWKMISNESFHVCKKSKSGTIVFLAGKDKIAVLEK